MTSRCRSKYRIWVVSTLQHSESSRKAGTTLSLAIRQALILSPSAKAVRFAIDSRAPVLVALSHSHTLSCVHIPPSHLPRLRKQAESLLSNTFLFRGSRTSSQPRTATPATATAAPTPIPAPAPAESCEDAGACVAAAGDAAVGVVDDAASVFVEVTDEPTEVRGRNAKGVELDANERVASIARLSMDQVFGEAVLDVEIGSLTLPVSGLTKYKVLDSQRSLSRAKVLFPHGVTLTPAISHAEHQQASGPSDEALVGTYRDLVLSNLPSLHLHTIRERRLRFHHSKESSLHTAVLAGNSCLFLPHKTVALAHPARRTPSL